MKLPHHIPYQGSKRNLANRILQYFPYNFERINISINAKAAGLTVLALFLISLASCTHKIDSVESLMKEISSRYYGKWFTHLKFSQTADTYENDSLVKSEIWDEEYYFPTSLKIYMTPGDTASTVLKEIWTFIQTLL